MAEERQDHSSWWESLEPGHDSPSAPFAFDDPVDWPSPVEWHLDGASPADVLRRALVDDIQPHQPPHLLPAPAVEGDAEVEAEVSDVTSFAPFPLDEAPPLPPPAQARPPVDDGPPATGTLVGAAWFARPAGVPESRDWREAVAGWSTETIVVGVLAVAGVVVMAFLFAARPGTSSTRSVQGRPSTAYVAADGAVATPPITSTTVTTVPATIDLRALAAAELAIGSATEPAQATSSATPGTTAPTSGQAATARPGAQSPAPTGPPAPVAPTPEPDPGLGPTMPPSATSTAPVVTTRAPRPTVPTFPTPTMPTSIPRPTFPHLTIPAGTDR